MVDVVTQRDIQADDIAKGRWNFFPSFLALTFPCYRPHVVVSTSGVVMVFDAKTHPRVLAEHESSKQQIRGTPVGLTVIGPVVFFFCFSVLLATPQRF